MSDDERLHALPGKYELLAKLSEGGMGAVLKVRHRHLDEVQVVKVVLPRFATDPELRERFLREARVAVQLRHPNVAQIYDLTVSDEGVAFLGMEFIDGTDLAAVRRSRRLEVREVVDIGLQALSALDYLHQKGFVHRDVSPENLMLAERFDGRPLVKLIDLGIAKHLEQEVNLTREGTFVGKVRYAAPEQFRGESVDHASDLYSLGVVLYELATGTHPIRGTTTEEIIAGHLMRPPLSFAESDPEGRVPERLRRALEKALAKEKDERFASARDFARALEAVEASPLPDTVVGHAAAQLEPTRIQGAAPAGVDPTVLASPDEAPRRTTPTAGEAEPTVLATPEATGAAPSPTEASRRKPGGRTEPSSAAGETGTDGRVDSAANDLPLRGGGASARRPRARGAARGVPRWGIWLAAAIVAALLATAILYLPGAERRDPLSAILAGSAGEAGALALTAPSAEIPVGEPLTLELASGEAGYLVLVARDAAGDLALLYPNGRRPQAPLEAGVNRLPLPADAARGYDLRASEPLGRERLVAIRTAEPLDLEGIRLPEESWLASFPRSGGDGGRSADALLAALTDALEPRSYAAVDLTLEIVPAADEAAE